MRYPCFELYSLAPGGSFSSPSIRVLEDEIKMFLTNSLITPGLVREIVHCPSHLHTGTSA